jgi:hypothetical protein
VHEAEGNDGAADADQDRKRVPETAAQAEHVVNQDGERDADDESHDGRQSPHTPKV